MTVAIFLHPPKDANTSKADYEIDSPAILTWWKREGIVGNAVLVSVEQLLPLAAGARHEELVKLLWPFEDAHVVMLVRRE